MTITCNEPKAKRSSRKILPVSAGALGVQLCRRTIMESGLDCNEVFGMQEEKRQEWNADRQRWVTTKVRALCPFLRNRQSHVVACFHGGRNETFYAGPTPIGWIHDFDVVAAYTTAMVLFRQIDYAASFETRDLSHFLGGSMGFARVEFEFPNSIRYPCLPVRNEVRGLLFPLRGTSYATAPEIELALGQGAMIKIRYGVVFPWKDPDGVRVFLRFVREIRRLRGMYPKKSLPEMTAKLLGNSVYGKMAQGLKGKNAFDTGSMASQLVPPSSVTNAPMAAMATGFVRGVVGEILHRLPLHRTAYSVTTDGILTDAAPDEIDLGGPLCQLFLELCEMVEA